MKIICVLLSIVFLFSFSVTAFAEVALDELGEVVPVEDSTQSEESGEATSGNEYLDMVLNNMQNDIDDLQSDVEVLQDDVSAISESDVVSDSTVEDVTSEEPEEINPELGIDESTPTAVNVYSLNPITSESTTGLKSVLLSLIGEYDAIVIEYEYQNPNSTYSSYLREVQPDYVWLCSAGIFLVIIYSVFRLGGALFRG